MPSKCACGCGWLVRAKGHHYGDHATNPPTADTFLADAQAANRRYNQNPNYGNPYWNPINNPIYNPIYNPINNPINNAIQQKRTREENEARIAKMPRNEDMLTEADAKAKAEQIMTAASSDGKTLEEMLGWKDSRERLQGLLMDYRDDERDHDEDSPLVNPESGEPELPPILQTVHSGYVGYTARTIEIERLRWLTERGASQQAEDGTYVDPLARNRPTLLHADGSTIKEKADAQEWLDFTAVEVYASTLMINARYVEAALQKRYQHLPLGLRLWRCVDKGGKYDKEIDGKVHKVFITSSPRVAQMLAERKIKVNF